MDRFEQVYQKNERERMISDAIEKLQDIFDVLPEQLKAAAELLIPDVAFLAATLTEARQTIIRDGIIDNYKNGENQYGVKKSAAVEVYDKLYAAYTKSVKQLCDMLPEESKSQNPADELMEFLRDAE